MRRVLVVVARVAVTAVTVVLAVLAATGPRADAPLLPPTDQEYRP